MGRARLVLTSRVALGRPEFSGLVVAGVSAIVFDTTVAGAPAAGQFLGELATVTGIVSGLGTSAAAAVSAQVDRAVGDLRNKKSDFWAELADIQRPSYERILRAFSEHVTQVNEPNDLHQNTLVFRNFSVLLFGVHGRSLSTCVGPASDAISAANQRLLASGHESVPMISLVGDRAYRRLPLVDFFHTLIAVTKLEWLRVSLGPSAMFGIESRLERQEIRDTLREVEHARQRGRLAVLYYVAATFLSIVALLGKTQDERTGTLMGAILFPLVMYLLTVAFLKTRSILYSAAAPPEDVEARLFASHRRRRS